MNGREVINFAWNTRNVLPAYFLRKLEEELGSDGWTVNNILDPRYNGGHERLSHWVLSFWNRA